MLSDGAPQAVAQHDGRLLGSSDRFALDQGEARCVSVAEGAADLFLVVPPPKGSGILRHVCRIERGQMFLAGAGVEPAVWLVVPVANTILVNQPLIAADLRLLPLIERLAEWQADPMQGAVQLSPTEARSFDAETVVAAAAEPSWLDIEAGALRFAHNNELIEAGSRLLVTRRSRYACEPGSRIATYRIDAAADAGMLHGVTAMLMALVARDHSRHDARRAEEEERRLFRRRTFDRWAAESGDRAIAGTLAPERRHARQEIGLTPLDPLIAVIAFVAHHEHIEFDSLSVAPPPTGSAISRLDAVLRDAGLMWRHARLDGKWRDADVGAFLAFRQEDDAVVAVYRHHRYYRVYDPVSGETVPLGDVELSALAERGVVIGRPLPAEPLKSEKLLSFGVVGRRGDLALLGAIGLASGLIGLLTPLVTSTIVGSIIPDADLGQLVQYGYLLAGMTAAVGLFTLAQSLTGVRLSGVLDSRIQGAIWDRLIRLPVGFFRTYTAGDLANRAMGINTINSTLTSVTLMALLTGLFATLNFALMLWYAWQLALIGLATALATLLVSVIAVARQLVWQRRATEAQGKLTGLTLQMIGGINKLRVAHADARAYRVWSTAYAEQNRLTLRAQRIVNGITVFTAAVPTLAAMILFMAIAAWVGTIAIGDFIAFNAAFGQFFSGIVGLSGAFASVTATIPLYRRVRPILDTRPEADSLKSNPGALDGRVALDRVSFAYERERPTLDAVSIVAEPGEFIAIVGPSGSGKSTIARLLIGFEEPTSGIVSYDHKDLATLNICSVRRQLGVVVQNSQVLPGNIFQVIAGNHPDVTLVEAWNAAAMVGLDKDIRAMPMKMETFVTEGATTFSVGQRQRLMIARAIVRQPRILIFDEATSALDNQTQAIVTASLARLDATRVVIAHRLSTIMQADRIYVLDGGRVCQTGTHDELIAQPGVFRDLATRQLI